ncbi:unnamed protein product [Enterobius vermicularis]|uniref:FBA domain-containing protein n=1 Tax=Enterobius vermicularis TaxID=51028 RepID=A0A0N4V8E2_ENTVE|nr:unnamed protein product [Enterobius vermicularis]
MSSMGNHQSSSSKSLSEDYHESYERQGCSHDYSNEINRTVTESMLAPDIIMEVLSRVDSPKFLITSCYLVCRRWFETLSTPYFWKIYQKRQFGYNAVISGEVNEHFVLTEFGVFSKFGKNLIANPSGQDGFNNWEITSDGGDRFIIESPPVNCRPMNGITTAFATSTTCLMLILLKQLEEEVCENSL